MDVYTGIIVQESPTIIGIVRIVWNAIDSATSLSVLVGNVVP